MKYVKAFLLCVVTVFSISLQAEAAVTAHQMVEQTTARVQQLIADAQGYIKEDPERFYREVDQVLDDVVDFKGFARGVMGKYASKQAYMALATAEEKQQFRDRVNRFSDVFKTGLVQTYAKGLLTFNGQRLEVVPPADEAQAGSGSVTVEQHIYGSADRPYVLFYKVRKNRAGQWKLRNVTIEAINLGKLYQSQFYSAMKQHQGDIDKVIETWSVTPGQPAPATTGV